MRPRASLRAVLSVAAASVAMALVAAAPVSAGPVILTGIDAEDCGPGGHGPIANYVFVVNDILLDATN